VSLTVRWLGVSGLEIRWEDGKDSGCDKGGHSQVLLVDPFFTRPSPLAMAFRRLPPDRERIARHITSADTILVTHPHYDHLMDVPEVMRLTGARAAGSPNTCALLHLHGLEEDRTTILHPGDRQKFGPFQVEVFPGYHTRTPIDRLISGPVRKKLRPPLHALDYRMDACYSYRITAGGVSLLVGSAPVPADVLFLYPYYSQPQLAQLLGSVQPKRVFPIHWEDFTRSLDRPLRPMLVTPAQGQPPRWMPVHRLDLQRFIRNAQALAPAAEIIIPALFGKYRMDDLVAYGRSS
jgi:L-ascorbate metabolism protein UlaG (beta-lactamase superfamily)